MKPLREVAPGPRLALGVLFFILFFAGEHAQFSKEAADLLLEIGTIKQLPDMTALADTSFIK